MYFHLARVVMYQYGCTPNNVGYCFAVVGEFQIPSMPKIVTTEATALILAA